MTTIVQVAGTDGTVAHTLTVPQPAGSLLHVTAGDDTWEPTQEEMEELGQLFLAATTDPNHDGVVVTRTGVVARYLDPAQKDSNVQ